MNSNDAWLIANTTKQQRIELIRSWSNSEDDGPEGCEIDLWDMYADYISGTREISECNASFRADYYEETSNEPPAGTADSTSVSRKASGIMDRRFCIAEASRLLDEGKLTPLDLVERAVRATQSYQKDVNAYITFLPDEARKEAENIYARMKKEGRWSPLTGIPFAVKDLIFAGGIPATAGSKQMKDFVPDSDAPVVEAMKKAGAILMGKTNTQEWGCGPTGEQSYFGPVHNPWDLSRISGGSSSGSAAALACGMVPAALGSDAGGSIRIPASLCGCVGLKTSFGLLSTEGSFRGSIHLGVEGPMANTVEDTAIMMDVLTGAKDSEYRRAVLDPGPFESRSFAVPRNLFMDCIQPQVLDIFERTVEKLKAAGARVSDHDIPWLADIPELSCAITFPEILYLHKDRLASDPEGYQPAIRARIEKGRGFSALQYIEAMQRREQLISRWNEFMKEFDALLMPTLPVAAEPLFTDRIEINGKTEDHSALLVRHTRASNVIGCPSVSVPAGFTPAEKGAPEGLPVGVMLMGGIMQDKELLRLARLIELLQ